MRDIIEDTSMYHPSRIRTDRILLRNRKNPGVSGISSAAVPRHDRRHRRSTGAQQQERAGSWLLTTRCARSCRSPACPKSAPARSRSPAAPTRSCRPRSASARPPPPRSPRPGSPSPISGNCAPAASSRSRSICGKPPPRLRSGHYLQMDGAEVSTERNPVMGVYPAKNGRWSYIHANFPNHRAAALKRARRARRTRTRCARRWRTGTRSSSRRRSSPPRAPAAWCAAWPNGRSTRRPPRSPRCRCWRSSRSATRRRKSCRKATGRSPASGCST